MTTAHIFPHGRTLRWLFSGLLAFAWASAGLGAQKKPATVSEIGKALQEELVTQAVGTLLNNQLPLKLDASTVFPTVASLPGAPFDPQRLVVTAESMNEPLPPGDYTVRAVAFCSEYSVHRAGAGVAYQLGPIQGRAAEAIAALYWRGIVEKRLPPRSLLVVGWSIQSGVTYAKMTKRYQAVIDAVIPDYKNQLGGDFVQNLEDLYTSRAKAAGLPPLNTFLAKLGKPGELVLSANRQRQVLLKKNTNDQLKDQVLFAGQEQRMAPVKPEEGPWTERIPGVAYVRYRVVGGNVRANNQIQIRILPAPETQAAEASKPRAMFASYSRRPGELAAASTGKNAAGGPTVRQLTGDGIGYSTSRAAQVLYFVPVPDPEPKDADAVGRVDQLEGTTNLTRDGETRPLKKGDDIRNGDTLTTSDDSRTRVTFPDGTQLTLAENTTVKIDEYVYSPGKGDGNHAAFSWIEGAFEYTSGLLTKTPNPDVNIHTPYGELGIRGTQFIGRIDSAAQVADVQLIHGVVECSPRRISTSSTQTGPVAIRMGSAEVTTAGLTLQEYRAAQPAVIVR